MYLRTRDHVRELTHRIPYELWATCKLIDILRHYLYSLSFLGENHCHQDINRKIEVQ